MSKSDEQLKALAELPEKVTIGDRQFKIYPPTRGKLEMIGDAIKVFIGVLDESGKVKADQQSNFIEQFNSSLKETCQAVAVLTKPNTGKCPEDDPELEEYLKWALDPAGVIEVIAHLMKYISFEDLLKNVRRAMPKASLAGQSLSPGSSSSPAGPSNISSGESVLEV